MNEIVVIFGGTFDPIHLGHLHIAKCIKQQLACQEIRFLPNYQSPTKSNTVASAFDRLAMLKLATESEDDYTVDTRELDSEHPCYSINSIQHIRVEVGKNIPLAFVMGMDSIQDFQRWREWTIFPQFCHLLILPRPGFSLPNTDELGNFIQEHLTINSDDILSLPAGKIFEVPAEPLDISSTQLRTMIQQGNIEQTALPQAVSDYVAEHGLYGYTG